MTQALPNYHEEGDHQYYQMTLYPTVETYHILTGVKTAELETTHQQWKQQ